jgi:hypothetical protein
LKRTGYGEIPSSSRKSLKLQEPAGRLLAIWRDRLSERGENVPLSRQEGVDPIFVDKTADRVLAVPKRGEHRADVRRVGIRRPRVHPDEGLDLRIDDARLHELHRGYLEALLIDAGVQRGDAARHAPADVGGVDECPSVADEFVAVVVGLDHVDVRKVRRQGARGERVVGDQHVTGCQGADGSDRRGAVDEGEQRRADRVRRREYETVEADDRRTEVLAVLHVERPACALERETHLDRDRLQFGGDGREDDGVEIAPDGLRGVLRDQHVVFPLLDG